MNTWDTSSKLRHGVKRRVEFDPSNIKHLEELRYFKTFKKWKSGCPFELTGDFLDIPAMISEQYLIHYLSKLPRETKSKK